MIQQTSIHGLKKFGKLGTQPKKMKYGIFLIIFKTHNIKKVATADKHKLACNNVYMED
jgi:hypothetical protein